MPRNDGSGISGDVTESISLLPVFNGADTELCGEAGAVVVCSGSLMSSVNATHPIAETQTVTHNASVTEARQENNPACGTGIKMGMGEKTLIPSGYFCGRDTEEGSFTSCVYAEQCSLASAAEPLCLLTHSR